VVTLAQPDAGFDYLLLSDVHLGSDIIPHMRPWARTSWLLTEAAIDTQLVTFLDHHAQSAAPGRRYCLVLAGDFLDLVGVALGPEDHPVETPLTAEERLCGLGSAKDHVVGKLAAIAKRHAAVFAALMRFVAYGHELVLVRGNHDIELHWRAAQRAFADAIVAHAPVEQRAELRTRIRVKPWFFCVEGVLYVEHGHEFDPMCSYGDPLLPTSEADTKRIRPTPFSVLLRQVARPTRGISSASYSYAGMGAYVRLLYHLGVVGTLQIAVRYSRACTRLVQATWERALDDGRRGVRRAEAHFRRFARSTGVSATTLRTLRSFYVAPAVQSLDFVLRCLYIDRIFSGLLALPLLTVAVLLGWLGSDRELSAALCAVPALFLGGYACIGRGSNTSPAGVMRESADRIARLFNTPWVAMGHVHEPCVVPLPSGATYVNLGSWGHDDPPDEPASGHVSPCTFLTLHYRDGAYHGEFAKWDPVHGASKF
jgi:UDP-2,3-diacylglucosamine pyrophosphatase LpxH